MTKAKAKAKTTAKLKVTLVRSIAGRLPGHQATVATLGLRRIRQTVELNDNPAVRGMLTKVGYMLKVEEI
jgi:large subunit ribosomal protein L30